MQLFYFLTPRKRQEISGFLTFAGGIEIWYWLEMGSVSLDGQMNVVGYIFLFYIYVYIASIL